MDRQQQQEQQHQDVERIMRRAAAGGHDPERVARALSHQPPADVERQPVLEFQAESWFGARVARRFARRS